MLCIAVYSSNFGVLEPGLFWLYIASSIHDLHGRPADSQAAKSSWNIGRPPSLLHEKSYQYHTLGKQVWIIVSNFHQFSDLRETAPKVMENRRVCTFKRFGTRLLTESHSSDLVWLRPASLEWWLCTHAGHLYRSGHEPICSILWSILNTYWTSQGDDVNAEVFLTKHR